MNPRRLAHEHVAHHARERPDAIAVEHGALKLTYAGLHDRAIAFARRLREAGVGTEDLVAIDAPRAATTLIAILGTWHAGAAYVPLDPSLPDARRSDILTDSAPRVLVSEHDGGDGIPRIPPPLARADGSPSASGNATALPQVKPDHLAYVLYTSGSTGRPKGVLVEHAGLAHRAEIQLQSFGIVPGEITTQYTSLAWDASLFELTLAWSAGATLCLIPEEKRRSGSALVRFLRERGAHVAFFPPSVLATLPHEPLPHLRMLMAGGDALPATLVDRWGGERRIVNLYGPTEATVWITTEECVPNRPVTIGRPIPGVDVHVLDESGRPVPPGEGGELAISGEGLARGYLRRQAETKASFVENAHLGTLVYLTGDRGRVLADGRIELHGRLDGQTKIRGVRIELGEIEAALQAAPGVRLAAVVADIDPRGEKRLVAYVTLDSTPEGAARLAPEAARRALRDALLATLPEPMVPAVIVEMAALPRLSNDKLDRRALPTPEALETRRVPVIEAPRNDLERLVARVWSDELKISTLGLHENVFEAGAHSLLAAHVQARLEAALGRTIDIVQLFEHPTVASLARALGERADDELTPRPAAASRAAARRAGLAGRARARTRGATTAPEESSYDE